MYEKDKKQLQEQLNNRYQEQVQALKKDMDARIAEVARLKSVEQIKLKKLAQQKAELEQRLTAETLQAQKDQVAHTFEKKERKVRQMEFLEKRLDQMA